MQELYLKIIELLGEIQELRYADLDTGQLQEEVPSLSFPAALVDIDLPRLEDLGSGDQMVEGSASVLLVFKTMGETNSLVTAPQRLKATAYMATVEKVYHNINGYADDRFYAMSCSSIRNEKTRKGLKAVRLTFGTSWHDYTAS